MTTRDIKLERKIWGSVFTCYVYLETKQEIGMWVYNSKKKIFTKELPQYLIEGDSLEIEIIVNGINGASATINVEIAGQEKETVECVIQGGNTIVKKSIPIKK